MFGIQTPELFVILVVAFVVLGPERLPVVARRLGRLMSELRSSADALRSGLESELEDVRRQTVKPVSEVMRPVRDAVDDITSDIKGFRSAAPLEWVGPEPTRGPTSKDASADFEAVEEEGESPE